MSDTTSTTVDGEHDFPSYDSSDVHLRTQEWEAQAATEQVIEFFVPKRKPLTPAQHTRINTVLATEMPGVSMADTVREHIAYKVLVGFVGAHEAARILVTA